MIKPLQETHLALDRSRRRPRGVGRDPADPRRGGGFDLDLRGRDIRGAGCGGEPEGLLVVDVAHPTGFGVVAADDAAALSALSAAAAAVVVGHPLLHGAVPRRHRDTLRSKDTYNEVHISIRSSSLS